MHDRIRVEIEPISLATAPDAATVITELCGVRNSEDQEKFDLFMIGADGEPSGECIGQIRVSVDISPPAG